MRAADLHKKAWGEFKVTRQISTGNGDAFLAQSERPPASFMMGELGYGMAERPCSDCCKPCTLDYTLGNLNEINGAHLRELNKRDPGSVPDRISSIERPVRVHFKLALPEAQQAQTAKKHKHRLSAAAAQRALRAQARRAGIRIVKGAYVDERPRTWLPSNPNAKGRRQPQLVKRKVNGKDEMVMVDLRAEKLIREHRKRQQGAARAAV